MNLNQGQYVKCWFRNNVMIEGYVESWTDKQSVLKSLDGKSILIIFNTDDDIVAIKVMLPKWDQPSSPTEIKTELEEKFQKIYDEPSDSELRVLKLSQLKQMMNEQEKKIITDKLKSHTIDGARKIEYGYPGIHKKPRSK